MFLPCEHFIYARFKKNIIKVLEVLKHYFFCQIIQLFYCLSNEANLIQAIKHLTLIDLDEV